MTLMLMLPGAAAVPAAAVAAEAVQAAPTTAPTTATARTTQGARLRAADAGLATLIYSRGPTATATASGALRIVGIGSPLQAGDLISTGNESFAVIELADTTRVMLRPDTAVRLAVLSAAAAAATHAAAGTSGGGAATAATNAAAPSDGVSLQLGRGGIRAHAPKAAGTSGTGAAGAPGSGATGAPGPGAAGAAAAAAEPALTLQVVTADATVTSHGADFIARTCNVDCAAERGSLRRVATPGATSVARALIVAGEVSITDSAGISRSIARGATLQVGDVISAAANAHAVIGFRDGTRVTVQPESAFKVEAYQLSAAQPDTETAQFRLQRGGMRAATGDIGHRQLTHMRFATPIATIGIRGTGFDALESAECGGQKPKDKPALTASVWNGAIVLQESNTVVSNGETVCQLTAGGKVFKANAPQLDTPRPDQVSIPQNTFDVLGQNGDETGLHLSAIDGDLTVSNDAGIVFLGSGEDGFVNTGIPERTQDTISLGRADPFLTLDLGGNPDQWATFQPQFGVSCPVGG